MVRADVDEAQAGPRRCTVPRRGVAVAERVQYGGPRRGPQVTAACARDDERGEGWAHFVLVSQGLLARVPSSDFPQIRATTKSYCCTQLELQHTYLSLEVLPAGQGAERCSWCEISGEAFLHELTMNSALLYPVYKRWPRGRA